MVDHDGEATPRRAARLILGGIAAGALLGTGIAAPTYAAAPEPTMTGLVDAGATERPAKTEVVDADVLHSLAAKLDALELSDAERGALTGLLKAAADQIGRSGTSARPAAAAPPLATPRREKSAASTPSFAEQFDTSFTPGAIKGAFDDEAVIVITGLSQE